MPDDNQESTPLPIEEVARPWYARPSNWFLAIAVAGGLSALVRSRNKRASFDANPQDEWWCLDN